MDKKLNKYILKLAIPSILANITVPLVGIVDTAVAGHIEGGVGAATYIGGISLGSMLFNLLYWNFSFLRTGTGGLTAQAYGREDWHECARIFARGIGLSLIIALGVLLIQWPFTKLCLMLVNGSDEAKLAAESYFFIRVWAAPATISLMAFKGWFVGMQDSMSSMWTDLIINIVNIVASVALAFGFGSYQGIGFDGVALGTVIAQYSGLVYALLVCSIKYGKKVFKTYHKSEVKLIFKGNTIRPYMKMNMDLVGRSIGFIGIYIGYTSIAAGFGDVLLACSAIMMEILMLFSYFTDGFAFAGEALVGRFIGQQREDRTKLTVKYVFVWSLAVSAAFIGIYYFTGRPIMRLMTSDATVFNTCCEFLPWLYAMPLLGCIAFTWDGIYLGATASSSIRNAMLGSDVAFFGVWFAGLLVFRHFNPGLTTADWGVGAMHLLLGAYFAHLVFRSVYLSAVYKKNVLLPNFSVSLKASNTSEK